MALHALAQCTARVLLTHEQDKKAFAEDWEVVRALAQLGMEERAKGGWYVSCYVPSHTHVWARRLTYPDRLSGEPDRALWKKAHKLYIQAFHEPATEPEKKRLARLLKKPLPKEVSDTLFDYDAFLRGLGRMSLSESILHVTRTNHRSQPHAAPDVCSDLEAHGGLYVLHSHLNHSCTPNVSARHFDQRTALSRITLVARRDIAPGEELLITYVNPELPVEQRRRGLMEWGFGKCMCERCVKEERERKDAGDTAGAEEGANADLEAELKAGLGVM